MRISDWSSDVCSSDLACDGSGGTGCPGRRGACAGGARPFCRHAWLSLRDRRQSPDMSGRYRLLFPVDDHAYDAGFNSPGAVAEGSVAHVRPLETFAPDPKRPLRPTPLLYSTAEIDTKPHLRT